MAGRSSLVATREQKAELRVLSRSDVRGEGDPASPALSFVEVVEVDPPPGTPALHWRLLTTLRAGSAAETMKAVRLYSLRWRVEQTFRMLKSDGLRLDEAQTVAPYRLTNLAAIAAGYTLAQTATHDA